MQEELSEFSGLGYIGDKQYFFILRLNNKIKMLKSGWCVLICLTLYISDILFQRKIPIFAHLGVKKIQNGGISGLGLLARLNMRLD